LKKKKIIDFDSKKGEKKRKEKYNLYMMMRKKVDVLQLLDNNRYLMSHLDPKKNQIKSTL